MMNDEQIERLVTRVKSEIQEIENKQFLKKAMTKIRAREKQYERFKSPSGRFISAKSQAKKRGIEFTVVIAWYSKLLEKPCFYCGDSLSKTGSGMDRIDNTKGYTKFNVVQSCGDCNRGRGDRYTSDEWKVMVRALVEYRTKKVQ